MTAATDPSTPAPLRRVHPPDAPYPGELVTGVAGRGYRVAAADVPRLVWSAPSDGHLLAAVDVDVDDGATMILLPRLGARLSAAGLSALSPGQAVTLAVSVLRGAVSAATEAWRGGEWWLTDDGRPVLAPVGEQSWAESSAELLHGVPDSAIDAATRRRVIDALTDIDALPRTAVALEDALFAGAQPEPLDRLLTVQPDPRAATGGEWPREARITGGRSFSTAAALVDAGILARVTAALDGARTALSRRRRPSSRRRDRREDAQLAPRGAGAARAPVRRLVHVVASVVAVILTGGLMWPSDGSNGAAVGAVPSTPSARASTPHAGGDAGDPASGARTESRPAPVSSDPESEPPPPGDDADPAAASIERLATCWRSDELSCRAGVLERADATVPEGVATADVERSVVLLDDLGGVEVVRVEDAAGELPPQIVVVVVQNDERLVRDVYDVADQP